ncbi:D-alanyl-lipoteichoic acid biosynthesis protein DltB [Staphylococcus arlettae]
MIPYGTFTFFAIAIVVLLPVVCLGFMGKRSYTYNFLSSLLMVVLIFASQKYNIYNNPYLSFQLFSFFGYIVWQVSIIMFYLNIRRRHNYTSLFSSVIFLAILPLLCVKLLQSSWLGDYQIVFHEYKVVNLIAFLGISYVTFKSVQLLMEIRDGSIKEVDVWKVIQFISFFPTISSGPIDRYKRFIKDDKVVPDGTVYSTLFAKALHFVMLGFLYKYIIAYLIQNYVIQPLLETPHNVVDTWLYMYAYSFYLFFDFAGYSLFALAFSYLYGIQTPPNFNQPFKTQNIKAFWQRWHMTLSFWFRDCIYMRCLFFMSKKKLLKSQFAMSNIAFIINFFLMGLWHGLELHYIVYGLYHAALFIGFSYVERLSKYFGWQWQNKFTACISTVITFHCVTFGFLIFSGQLI